MTGLRPILVPTDFSAAADRALDLATTIARRHGVAVVLLHVDTAPDTAPLGTEALARRERTRAALDQSRRALEGNSVPARVMLRPGDPAREILRVAESCAAGMIVMGAHGESSSTAPLLGSVVDRVVRYAHGPVLVVPEPDRRPAAAVPVPRVAAG